MEVKSPRIVKEVQSLTGKVVALNRFVSRATDNCLLFFKVLKKALQWTNKCEETLTKLKKIPNTATIVKPFNNRRKATTLFGNIQLLISYSVYPRFMCKTPKNPKNIIFSP